MPEQVAKMKDEARTFIKTIINKMSERNQMSTVIALRSGALTQKSFQMKKVETKSKKPYLKIC